MNKCEHDFIPVKMITPEQSGNSFYEVIVVCKKCFGFKSYMAEWLG